MQYSHQKTLIFVCTILSGCAEGVTGEDPPNELTAAQASSVPLGSVGVDAGPIYTPGAVSSAPESATVSPQAASGPFLTTQDAGYTVTSPVISTSVLDAAVPSSAVPGRSVPTLSPDAGVPALSPDASVATLSPDAGVPATPSVSSATDAAVSSRSDASATPASAPVCAPAQCNSSCGLLPRCCNAQNQCACFSLLQGSCSLPSL